MVFPHFALDLELGQLLLDQASFFLKLLSVDLLGRSAGIQERQRREGVVGPVVELGERILLGPGDGRKRRFDRRLAQLAPRRRRRLAALRPGRSRGGGRLRFGPGRSLLFPGRLFRLGAAGDADLYSGDGEPGHPADAQKQFLEGKTADGDGEKRSRRQEEDQSSRTAEKTVEEGDQKLAENAADRDFLSAPSDVLKEKIQKGTEDEKQENKLPGFAEDDSPVAVKNGPDAQVSGGQGEEPGGQAEGGICRFGRLRPDPSPPVVDAGVPGRGAGPRRVEGIIADQGGQGKKSGEDEQYADGLGKGKPPPGGRF